MEQWKDIEGFPGYQVSNQGNYRSIDRTIELKNGNTRRIKGQQLKTFVNQYGYEVATLYAPGKRAHKELMHRLVAKAFLPNPDGLPTVDHINGNRVDNRADNLRWATQQDNLNNRCWMRRIAQLEALLAEHGIEIPDEVCE